MFKKTFVNESFCLKVSTTSRRIMSLVNKYLDFNGKGSPDPNMIIDFCIKEREGKSSPSSRTFIYPRPLMKDKKWTGSLFVPIAEAKVDYKTKTIRVLVNNFQDSLKEPLLDFIIFKTLRLILAKDGFHWLHASMVSNDEGCILICGPQNSGKSTLAFVCAQHGFRFLCDDDCFVKSRRNRISLVPFPTKMGISSKLLDKHPVLEDYLVKNYHYGGKQRISLSHIYDVNKRYYDSILILFPQYSKKEKLSIMRVSKQEALRKLIMQNADLYNRDTDPEGFSKIFFTFQSLINRARCFEVVYNDRTVGRIPKELESRIHK